MIREHFRYYLLTNEGNFKRELTNVESCSVSYNSLSRLKQSASITISLNLNEKLDANDMIRVIHVLNEKETPIGTFLISTPISNINPFMKTIDIECYSTLWLLDANKTISRLAVYKGTNVVNEIIRILGEYNIHISIAPSTKTTSTDREWEIGTPILDICNDLLKSINYTTLYIDALGAFSAKEYELPQDRGIEFAYDETDKSNILEDSIKSEIDLFDVPNIFVKYVNNPDAPNLIGSFENSNPQSPTSTANRPKNVNSEEVQDAADVQTLVDMCKRDAASVANKYHKIEFRTAINPNHTYMNCIYINLNTLIGKFTETSWDIECKTGGVMTHAAREVLIV